MHNAHPVSGRVPGGVRIVWDKGHIALNASGTDIGFFHFIRLSIGVGIIFLLRGFAKWALLFI